MELSSGDEEEGSEGEEEEDEYREEALSEEGGDIDVRCKGTANPSLGARNLRPRGGKQRKPAEAPSDDRRGDDASQAPSEKLATPVLTVQSKGKGNGALSNRRKVPPGGLGYARKTAAVALPKAGKKRG